MRLEVISHEPARRAKSNPILFVHGMWQGAWAWEKYFLPYFSDQGYTAQALSLRGHGKSECAGSIRWVGLKDYVADVMQVAEKFATEPILIGHSMGGLIVQKYLEIKTPPAAVLLASAPPSGLLSSTIAFVKRRPLAFLKSTLTLSPEPLIETPNLYREMFFSDGLSESCLQAYFENVKPESYRVLLDMIGLDLPRAKQSATPVLVIGATRDQSVLPSTYAITAKTYQTSPIMFEMAHNMMLEADWLLVAERILSWLREQNL